MSLSSLGIWRTDGRFYGLVVCYCVLPFVSPFTRTLGLFPVLSYSTNKQTINLHADWSRTCQSTISCKEPVKPSGRPPAGMSGFSVGTGLTVRNRYVFFPRPLHRLPFPPAVSQHPSCSASPPPLGRTGVFVHVLMGQQILLIINALEHLFPRGPWNKIHCYICLRCVILWRDKHDITTGRNECLNRETKEERF